MLLVIFLRIQVEEEGKVDRSHREVGGREKETERERDSERERQRDRGRARERGSEREITRGSKEEENKTLPMISFEDGNLTLVTIIWPR
jgi:hypothetical protein